MTWNKGKTWEEQGIVGEKKDKRIAHLRKIASMGGKASVSNVKSVAQFDTDGNFITSYYSAHDAARILHTSYQNICKVCNGERDFCLGYRWEWDKRKLNY